jgi:hypothetical protein
MSAVTKNDVFAYVFGLPMSREERLVVEHALETSPLVRYWYRTLTSDDDIPALKLRCAVEELADQMADAWMADKESFVRTGLSVLNDPYYGNL